VLVGALAEGEIHVPRLGRIRAQASFRLIAAMNPFDAIGTARVSQAISDRMCRISIGYQDAPGEREIVARATGTSGVAARGSSRPLGDNSQPNEPEGRGSALVEPAVTLTRLTREHAQVRMGASVRGAIDLVRLGRELSALRGEDEPSPGDATFADAAIAALSGRLRLDEGCEQTAEAIVLELIERLKPVETEDEDPPGKRAGGRAPIKAAGPAAP
jgi:MoxR-like ATPase